MLKTHSSNLLYKRRDGMGSEAVKTPADSRSEAEKSETLISPPSHESEAAKVENVEHQGTSGEQISVINEDVIAVNRISKIRSSSGKQLTDNDIDIADAIVQRGEVKNKQIQALKQLSIDDSFVTSQTPPRIENETETSFLSSGTHNFTEDNSSTGFTLLLRKDSHQFCRICHEVGSEDVFISPCRCKGSLSLVHKWCLERWLAESDTNHCELCGFVFNVLRKPKYNILTSIFLWLWSAAPRRERRLLLCDSLLFAALCPLIILTTILAFQVADSILGPEINEKIIQLGLQLSRENIQLIASLMTRLIQMTIVSFVITIDVGFVSWSVLRSQHHIQRWYKWYRRNCKVVLRGYPEIRRPNLPSSESSSNIRIITF